MVGRLQTDLAPILSYRRLAILPAINNHRQLDKYLDSYQVPEPNKYPKSLEHCLQAAESGTWHVSGPEPKFRRETLQSWMGTVSASLA